MSTFLSTANMVLPMFLIVLAGYAARCLGLLPESLATKLNSVCYRVLIPCSMFRSAQRLVFEVQYLWYFLLVCGAFLITGAALVKIVPLFVEDRLQAGAVAQTCFRCNIAILGYSMMLNVCGEENAAPMVIAVAAATISCNIAVPVVLTYFSGGAGDGRLTPKGILIDFLHNPLVIGTALGVAANLARISLPTAVSRPIADLAACATPIAMLSVGLRLNFASISGNRRIIAIASFIKLVAFPLVWTLAAAALGFRGYAIAAIVIGLGSMTVTIAPAVAEAYGCDPVISGDILIVQTVCAMFTMFLGVWTIRMLGIIP